MYELHIETEFAAAHFLREYKGKCENLHGHNWKVEVHLRGEKLDRAGLLMDFHDAKTIINGIINRFDHKYLNDTPEFETANPTTENLSHILYDEIAAALPEGVSVARVTCWESARCGASYYV